MSTQNERFTDAQVQALEKALNPRRVRTVQGEEYLPIKDVNAKLNELFGFGGWSRQILSFQKVVDEKREAGRPGDNRAPRVRQDVGYLCHVRIIIHASGGDVVRDGLGYVESASYLPNLPNHQTPALGAASAATKFAAKTLGNQFGLTLGDKDDPYGERRADYDAWRHEQESQESPPPEPEPEPELTEEQYEANRRRVFDAARTILGDPKDTTEEEPEALEVPIEPQINLLSYDTIGEDIFSSGDAGLDVEDFLKATADHLGRAWKGAMSMVGDPSEHLDPAKMLPDICRSTNLVTTDGDVVEITAPADLRRLSERSLYWLGVEMENFNEGE